MRVKLDSCVDVYYDIDDKKIYCIVKYAVLDGTAEENIVCVSEVIK